MLLAVFYIKYIVRRVGLPFGHGDGVVVAIL